MNTKHRIMEGDNQGHAIRLFNKGLRKGTKA
jgi:hypothetical protein